MYQYNLGIRFEAIVKQYPDNFALRFSQEVGVTYDELNKKVNQLARFLLANEVRQNDVVCISGNKILPTFACMIACLKIGAIYTILDPESPVERLIKMIKTALPKALFVEHELGQSIIDIGLDKQVLILNNEENELESRLQSFDQKNLKETRKITEENPAYIMFTSGSTGFPKGAVMTHQNVLNFIDWSIETYQISTNDILTNVNPAYFDNSVFDFYSSLFSGACMVPFSKETVTDPKLLISLIDSIQCTSWFSVPSMLIYFQTMKALNKDNLKSIKRFIFGGEGYPKAKLKKLYDLYSERADLFNVYGPTECTCICSSYRITYEDFEDIQGFPPLGDIIDNFSYLILDDNDQKVPEGDVGELCLLGPNVGKGYYNNPERMKNSFIQNPYNKRYSEVIYKTGDLVRYNSEDRKIYILGRKDHQIKHMGYRIELEEIETALSCLDYISQAAVLHGDYRGLSHIVAVVCIKNQAKEAEIRHDLKKIIPDYMIPRRFHLVNELPKNTNGKVDRRELTKTYLSN